MKKSVATIESLDKKFDQIDFKFDQIDQKFDKFGQILENIQGSIEGLVKKVAENTQSIEKNTLAIDDNTSSIEFLIEHAVMKDELGPIIKEEIDARLIPMESRLMAAIDGMLGKNKTMDDEVLAHTHRIDRLEKFVGLPKTA